MRSVLLKYIILMFNICYCISDVLPEPDDMPLIYERRHYLYQPKFVPHTNNIQQIHTYEKILNWFRDNYVQIHPLIFLGLIVSLIFLLVSKFIN